MTTKKPDEDKDLSHLGDEVLGVLKRFVDPPAPTLPRLVSMSRTAEFEADAGARSRVRFEQLERWGVPHKIGLLLVGQRERDVTTTEAMAQVSEFAREAATGRQNILVLAGSMGTGKTVAAAHFLEVVHPPLPFGRTWGRDQGPRWYHASDLVALCHRRDGHDVDNERRLIRNAKVMAIDDLGVEYSDGKGYWLSFCDWLVNVRIEAMGATVITTNLLAKETQEVRTPDGQMRTLPSFQERYGERVYDRLREAAVWWNLVGESMRGEPGEQGA